MLLCLAMVMSLFAACGDGNGTTNNKGNDGDNNKITIGMPQDTKVIPNYDENAYTKWLEAESGYDIGFVLYNSAAADYKT